MQQQVRHQLWIVAAAAVVLLTNLGAAALWDEDEPLYAACAREMSERGDWVVPTFNGRMFAEKPPLVYWLMIGSFRLFGPSELAARFPSAILGVATALLTYHLGRLLFRAQVGFWAGLIVVTSIMFAVSGRAATTDSTLVFLTTAAMLCLVAGGLARRRQAAGGDSPAGQAGSAGPLVLPDAWLPMALFYGCLGLAVLAKGPIGLLLPVAMIGLLEVIAGGLWQSQRPAWAEPGTTWAARLIGGLRLFHPWRLLRVGWQMRPLTALVVVGAIAAPWYVLVGTRTHGAFLREFLGEQNLGRALKAMQGHGGPFFYYVPAILIGFFPWSVFLAPTLIEAVRRMRRDPENRVQTALVVCWLLVFVVFWSIPSTKLPHYVLTAYPALALLTGLFVSTWIADPDCLRRGWIRSATVTYVVVGVAMLVALPIVTHLFLPGESMLGLVGLILVVGGGLGLLFAERRMPLATMTTSAVTAVLLLTAMFGFAALRVDRYQNAPAVMAAVRRASAGPPRLAAYRFFKESLVFYAGGTVPRYEQAKDVEAFLSRESHPYVVTTDKFEAELKESLGDELFVLFRQPRFLHSGEVVVLARRPKDRGSQIAAESGAGTRR